VPAVFTAGPSVVAASRPDRATVFVYSAVPLQVASAGPKRLNVTVPVG